MNTILVRHALYLSQAVPSGPLNVFAEICRRARDRNASLGVGGVLLYDGQRFAQWLCGPDMAVAALRDRIVADPRHEGVQFLLDGTCSGAPPVPMWRAGYIAPEALPTFMAHCARQGADPMSAFAALLPMADLWPAMPSPPALAGASGSLDTRPLRALARA